MSDSGKILREITKEKNFRVCINKPFNDLSLNFINEFSIELKKDRDTYRYLDLIYLSNWCSKKKISELKKRYVFKNLQIGRGLIFHISPSNVPTNFVYSFIFGLLSGNSNVIKLPSSEFAEKKIILKIIKKLLNKKMYSNFRFSNCFISYDTKKDNEITKKLSSICDVRVIWGGDETVNSIRKIWKPERSTEITFPDRYSLSVINLDELIKLNSNDFKVLIKNFFYDGYTMNQLACNSPHFVFWLGKNSKSLKKKFWAQLSDFVKKKYQLDEKNLINKYTNLVKNIFIQDKFKNFEKFDNLLYVVDPNKNIQNIENIRGESGTFFQINIKSLLDLKKYVTKKCQTVTYYGLKKNDIENFLILNNVKGIDRVVPIGSALDMDVIWDGYNMINSLSREIPIYE